MKNINQVFTTGEDLPILECPNCELLDASVYVIACCYVFDVLYPGCFSGVLNFLHYVGLICCVDNVFR